MVLVAIKLLVSGEVLFHYRMIFLYVLLKLLPFVLLIVIQPIDIVLCFDCVYFFYLFG